MICAVEFHQCKNISGGVSKALIGSKKSQADVAPFESFFSHCCGLCEWLTLPVWDIVAVYWLDIVYCEPSDPYWVTPIMVICVFEWKTTHSERQPRVRIEVDLKGSRMSVTGNKLSSWGMSVWRSRDKGTNSGNKDLDWQDSHLSFNTNLYVDGQLA